MREASKPTDRGSFCLLIGESGIRLSSGPRIADLPLPMLPPGQNHGKGLKRVSGRATIPGPHLLSVALRHSLVSTEPHNRHQRFGLAAHK